MYWSHLFSQFYRAPWYYHVFCVSKCAQLDTSRNLKTYILHFTRNVNFNYYHHKRIGLGPLIRSVSRITAARNNASSVLQLFSFLVVCSDMISNGFGFVAFFASVKASSVCIHLSCLVCVQSVVRGVCIHLFCGHKWCSLPEISVTSFLPLQFFVFVKVLESNFLTHIRM